MGKKSNLERALDIFKETGGILKMSVALEETGKRTFFLLWQPMDDMAMRNWFDKRRISPVDGRAKENRFIAVRSSQDTLVPHAKTAVFRISRRSR